LLTPALPLGEFDIIRRFFSRSQFPSSGVVKGIGDDAAILHPESGYDLIAAADVLNEGIHFPKSTSPHAIGYKALAVNLSDLAAMGAEPLWFTMTLSLPEANEDWLSEFSRGLFEIADQFGISLVGGDTVKGPLSIGIHVLGRVPEGMALRRDGAKPGDKIYVSGNLGGAALALKRGSSGHSVDKDLQKKLDYPEPRIDLGRRLLGVANSCIDISDGLLADLCHILEVSSKGAEILAKSIPLSEFCQEIAQGSVPDCALNGGDDYELCFTVPKEKSDELNKIISDSGIQITCIGEISGREKLIIKDEELAGAGLRISGFNHFEPR